MKKAEKRVASPKPFEPLTAAQYAAYMEHGLLMMVKHLPIVALFGLVGLFGCCRTEPIAVRDVCMFGAKGDGVTDDTDAIQRAIDAGGEVRFAPGTYVTGTLYLKSNGGLALEDGATLLASTDPAKWNKRDFCPQNAALDPPQFSCAHLICCVGQTNVFLRGGTIDGRARLFMKDTLHFACCGRLQLDPGSFWPRQMIYFCESSDIRISDVRTQNSPYWNFLLHGCRDVDIRRVVVRSEEDIAENDGIDIDCCQNVLVADCDVETGDDGITVRAVTTGLTDPRPCENVLVSNCVVRSWYANGFRIGVGRGEIRNCRFSKIRMPDTRGGILVNSKFSDSASDTPPTGVYIHDLVFEDIDVDASCWLSVQHDYRLVRRPYEGALENIVFRNCRGRARMPRSMHDNGVAKFRNVTFENCTVKEDTSAPGDDYDFFLKESDEPRLLARGYRRRWEPRDVGVRIECRLDGLGGRAKNPPTPSADLLKAKEVRALVLDLKSGKLPMKPHAAAAMEGWKQLCDRVEGSDDRPFLLELLRISQSLMDDRPPGPRVGKPLLIYNEDDSNQMSAKPAKSFVAWMDYVCRGGAVTHFFMTPNAMRSNIDSKFIEPKWKALEEADEAIMAKWPKWLKGHIEGLKWLHDNDIDPYAIWVKRAREIGVSPWLSMRMNDTHSTDDPTWPVLSTTWKQHPEYWRMPNDKSRYCLKVGFDFRHEVVRQEHIGYIRELLEKYDVDGLELDWMRFPYHLAPGREREDAHFLTEVVREARRAADAAAKRLGHPVQIGCRVTTAYENAMAIGTDPVAWAKEKLIDLLVVCNFWGTDDFNIDYRDWCRRIHAANPRVTVVPGLDDSVSKAGGRRKLTLPEYRGWADALYAQGAPGAYLFNFFNHVANDKLFCGVLGGGLSPEAVEAGARVIPYSARDAGPPELCNRLFPYPVSGAAKPIPLQIGLPPPGGVAQLRLAFDGEFDATNRIEARVNGRLAQNVRPAPCDTWLLPKSTAKTCVACDVDVSDLRCGINELRLADRGPAEKSAPMLVSCEIELPAGSTKDQSK